VNNLVAATTKNADAVKNGIWRTFSTGVKEFRVKILPSGSHNDALQKKAAELLKVYQRSNVNLQQIDPKKQKKLTAELYAATVVVDWNADDFGEPYSPEAVERTMLSAQEFADWLVEESRDISNFRDEEKKEVSGNSQEP